jgi:hypothetical protein
MPEEGTYSSHNPCSHPHHPSAGTFQLPFIKCPQKDTYTAPQHIRTGEKPTDRRSLSMPEEGTYSSRNPCSHPHHPSAGTFQLPFIKCTWSPQKDTYTVLSMKDKRQAYTLSAPEKGTYSGCNPCSHPYHPSAGTFQLPFM